MTSTVSGKYLVSPVFDWAFFLSPPVVALAIGIAISGTDFVTSEVALGGGNTVAGIGIGILIHAHLVAVAFRSHGNRAVFRRHRARFVVVPLVLWGALMISEWIAVAATVVATFWDVWHSGAQTFGFARIYDRNAGVPVSRDRALDLWANQALYAGPILAGATLLDHLEDLSSFDDFDDPLSLLLARGPVYAEGHRAQIAWLVIALATAILVVYAFVMARRAMRGEPISTLKIVLVVTTGLCSVYTWGFDSWGEAFFVMNLFHAVQYLALVWASESARVVRSLGLQRFRFGRAAALGAFFGTTLLYGALATLVDVEVHAWWSLTIVVSLMHFWYDGFVWSVRRRDV